MLPMGLLGSVFDCSAEAQLTIKNKDKKVINDFGDEWSKFSWLNQEELEKLRMQLNLTHTQLKIY